MTIGAYIGLTIYILKKVCWKCGQKKIVVEIDKKYVGQKKTLNGNVH